jgi:anti-sigma-K factor RskA
VNLDDSQDQSPDLLAAEYVLGTLDAPEREQAQALIASDPAFATLARQWERQLGELNALAGGVEPPLAIWDAIKAKLPELPQTAPLRLPELPRPPPPPANVIELTARLSRLRMAAAATGTMAAVFAMFILGSAIAPTILPDALRPKPRVIVQMAEGTAPPPRFVAALQRDAAAPAFILTVDFADRSLTLRRVSAEREPGKSYELWLVSNKFPAPRSLGVVSGGEFTQSGGLAPYDPATISDATFAVSLEPEGGSPTGAPSNVMFLGKLVESTPPQAGRPAAH